MQIPATRLNLLIPTDVRKRLESLTAMMGLRTMTDVIIRALRLAELCVNAENDGAIIVAQYPDGRKIPLPRTAA